MNFQDIEKKWQQRWREDNVFEPSTHNKDKFFITIPYPYISGSLHIGHARVVTEADVFARFQRMKGKNVLYPLSFHISGTPVLGISKAIEKGDKKKIELYKQYVRSYISDENQVNSIVQSFQEPQAIVDFFVPKMKEEFSSLGLSVDWTRSFTSGDFIHQKLVEWQFRIYEKKGCLVRGKYPVLFSIEYDNAVGEDDITDGDTSPVEKQEFTLIKFAYTHKNKPCFLLAATLRPETMYGQTNMWVNPDTEYQLIDIKPKQSQQTKSEQWVVSKECAQKLSYQDYEVRLLDTIKGTSLIGTYCHAPFIDKDIIILPSIHCDPDKGTGLVTSVPSDAPFDYIALKELQDDPKACTQYKLDHKEVAAIKLLPIITTKNYGLYPAVEEVNKHKITSLHQTKELEAATQAVYKAGFHTGLMHESCGPYKGLKVEIAKERMKQALLTEGQGAIFYETSRKALDRSGGKIIVAVLDDQWFLDFNAKDWKAQTKQVLDACELWPDKYRKEFEDCMVWLDKRPCARRRGLGTRLPQDPDWVVESLSDSTLYMTLYTFAHKVYEFGLTEEHLTDEFFDYVFGHTDDLKALATKLKLPRAQLEEIRTHFEFWYPNDHRHTFPSHLTNHLSFSLFAHAACLPKNRWLKRISFHGMVNSEGQKMSKSKGNVVTLLDVKNRFGADPFRAFMCSSTSVMSTFNWSDLEVHKIQDHLKTLYELINPMAVSGDPSQAESLAAKAFLSWFNRRLQEVTKSFEHMDLRVYANFVLFELYNRYKKLVMQCGEEDLAHIQSYLNKRWITLLSPLVPHLAEELYDSVSDGLASLAHWPQIDKQYINEQAEELYESQENLLSDIRAVIALAKIEQPSSITLITAHEWKYTFLKELKVQLDKTRDYKELIAHFMSQESYKPFAKDINKLLASLLKNPAKIPQTTLSAHEELESLQGLLALIKKSFGCTVNIEAAKNSKEPKASAALPAKPAIVVK